MTHPSQLPPRSRWPALLSRLSRDELTASVTALKTADYTIAPLRQAEDGFALLQLEDSCQYQPFNLGELPLATAVVAVTAPDGTAYEGACQLMTADTELVTAIAVWDAILAATDAQPAARQQGVALLAEGQKRQDAIDLERKAILARTKVNFTMMDE